MKQKWQLWINGPLYWIQLHIWHRNPLLAAHQVSQKRALLVSFVLLLLLITVWPYTLWICKRWQTFKGFLSREIYFTSPNSLTVISCLVVSWESEATPSATPFFKRAYKISHPPRLWVSWIDLPSFASLSKIWPNFSNKVFFSWSYEKVILTKNVRLTYYSSMKKKIRKIRMIFDIENSLWKSNFRNCTNLSDFFFHWRISV